MSFGQRLKEIRRESGLSQTDLATLLGVHLMTVSRWETSANIPNIQYFLDIKNLFNVSSDYLLGLSDENLKHA